MITNIPIANYHPLCVFRYFYLFRIQRAVNIPSASYSKCFPSHSIELILNKKFPTTSQENDYAIDPTRVITQCSNMAAYFRRRNIEKHRTEYYIQYEFMGLLLLLWVYFGSFLLKRYLIYRTIKSFQISVYLSGIRQVFWTEHHTRNF